MKAHELIAILQQVAPDAEVHLDDSSRLHFDTKPITEVQTVTKLHSYSEVKLGDVILS